MGSLTRWVLSHKRIVVVFWVVITLIGVASAGSASKPASVIAAAG